MSFGQAVELFLPLVLNLAVVYRVTRGWLTSFPLVFCFCLTQILVEAAGAIVNVRFGPHARFYFEVFWAGDLLAHTLVIVLISMLIRRAVPVAVKNRAVVAVLLGMAALAASSLVILYSSHINRWMTPVTRNMSFGEELLNLILWTLLLQKSDYDYQLLVVSAGIGIQVTGEVIGHTLRLYTSNSSMWVPDQLVFISEMMCLLVWLWAFPERKPATQ